MQLTKTLLASLIGLALLSPAYGDEVVNVEESSTSYQYTDEGKISQIDGPRTDVEDITRYEYQEKFILHKLINALGHTKTFTDFTPLRLPQTVIDENGVKTTLKYDLGNRVTEYTIHSTKGKQTHKITYDKVGQAIQIEQPDGSKLKMEYSDARYLMAIENDRGERIEYDYDNAGNRIKTEVKSSSGQIVAQHQRVFDEMSRLLKSIDADGHTTQFSYDPNSNLTGINNAREHKTTRQFDVLNRLVKRKDALEQTSEKVYDKFGDVVKIIAPNGATTTFKYDRRHRVIERNSPDTGKTSYAYDAASNLIQKINALGIETRYSYDALNRLISQQYPNAPELNISYIYDETANGNKGIGRLTGIQDQSG
uniref:hypothetical protein n=1 Tax=Zooshikella ganghwensis TaxID=202772 RepID=UPI0004879F0D